MSDDEVCPHCEYGFTPGLPVEQRYIQPDKSVKVVMVPTSKPCRHCHAEAFEAWEKRVRDRRRRVRPEERTFEANPQAGLASVRDALAKAAHLSDEESR